MRTLLVYAPYGNVCQPYSSLPSLTGFLKRKQLDVVQWDFNVTLVNECLRPHWVETFVERARAAFAELNQADLLRAKDARRYYALARILPYASLFENMDAVVREVRTLSTHIERPGPEPELVIARYFELISAVYYPERIDYGALTAPQHKPVHDVNSLRTLVENVPRRSLVDDVGSAMLAEKIERIAPDVVGISVTFSDQMVGAFKLARMIRDHSPDVVLVLGGAWVNAVCRRLEDPAFFEYFDYVVLDAGEWPLYRLLLALRAGERTDVVPNLVCRRGNDVVHTPTRVFCDLQEYPAPDFTGIPFELYLQPREYLALPLMVSHGCYWRQCTFCDKLPYVLAYQPQSVDRVVEKIETMVEQTGLNTFHFVDEAVPPRILRLLCRELLRKNINIKWWSNLRLERAFTREFCRTLRRAGMFRVMAGIESCNEQILEIMNKGISFATMREVIDNFIAAGIRVHTYLILGMPTETREQAQETMDRLEELILAKKIHSVGWHSLIVTRGSAIAEDPRRFGITHLRDPADLSDSYTQLRYRSGLSVSEGIELRHRFERRTRRALDRAQSQFCVFDDDPPPSVSERRRPMLPDHVALSEADFPLSLAKAGHEDIARKKSYLIVNLESGQAMEIPEALYRLLESLDGSKTVKELRLSARLVADFDLSCG